MIVKSFLLAYFNNVIKNTIGGIMKEFISCVRFQSMEENLEELELKLKEFILPTGAKTHTIVKTGDYSFCTFIVWDSENDLINAREAMISYLDTIRHLLKVISPELGVTDPVSGPVFHIHER